MTLHLDRGRRTAWSAGFVAVALVAAVAFLVLPSGHGSTAAPDATPGSVEQRSALRPLDPRPAGRPPNRLVVPSLGIEAPLEPIEVSPAGVLTPPDDGDVVGWWRRSAQPGDRQGQTVVTGHTVRSGPAAMNELGTVEKGAVVRVHDDGVVVEYHVTGVVKYPVATVAEKAYDLFAQDRGKGRLVMVTCTDYVDGDYRSNVVVFAEPVGQTRKARRAA